MLYDVETCLRLYSNDEKLKKTESDYNGAI